MFCSVFLGIPSFTVRALDKEFFFSKDALNFFETEFPGWGV